MARRAHRRGTGRIARARAYARRLATRTVWDPSLLQEVPRRFLGLYRAILPLQYLIVAAFATLVLFSRGPSVIGHITSGQYSELWTFSVAVLCILAGIGLVFRLERLELVTTIMLCAGLLTYPIANIIIGAHDGSLRQMGLGVVLFQVIFLPGWRVFDIARTARRRDA